MKIKYLNLNIWLGGKIFDPMIDFLKKETADILTLQEVYDGKSPNLEKRFQSFEILKKELGYPHVFFAPAMIDVLGVGKIIQGNAIFSRFPIIERETIFYDIPFHERKVVDDPKGDYTWTPRNLQHAVVDAGKVKLNIFNTQGIWARDGRDSARRLAMSKTIFENIRGKENVILSGDLNVNPDTETIRNIEKHLRSIFGSELKTTFNVKQKTNLVFSSIVVDYIFASPTLKITDHYCPPVDVSDHLPLVAVFEV